MLNVTSEKVKGEKKGRMGGGREKEEEDEEDEIKKVKKSNFFKALSF